MAEIIVNPRRVSVVGETETALTSSVPFRRPQRAAANEYMWKEEMR